MQIAAPSNELAPPMSMVRFDWTKPLTIPVPTPTAIDPVQGKTGGKLSGNFTLIWYSPTCPGVRPMKTGPERRRSKSW